MSQSSDTEEDAKTEVEGEPEDGDHKDNAESDEPKEEQNKEAEIKGNETENKEEQNEEEETKGDEPEHEEGRGARKKKSTEKGKAFQIETYEKGLRYAISSWRAKVCKASVSLVEGGTRHGLKQHCSELSDGLTDITLAYDKLKSVTDDDKYYRLLEDAQRETQDVLKSISARVEVVRYEESAAGSVKSHHSQRSNASRRSKASSSGSLKLEAAAKEAELRAKLEFFELEAKQRMELERIQLKKELSMARARNEVLSSSELDPTANPFIPSMVKKEPLVVKEEECPEPPASEERNPLPEAMYRQRSQESPQVTRERDDFSQLASVFTQQVQISRLPPPEPGVFSGDPIGYSAWRTAFDLLINTRMIPEQEKLHYLKRYLAGDAKEAVEGFFMQSTADAFRQAMEQLERRYGDRFTVANAFRDRLEQWPKIGPKDGKGLRRLADFLKQCEAIMASLSTLDILNDERENRKILSKLPDWLVLRWGRIAARSKIEGHTFPTFKEFVRFVQTEAEIANDPVISLQSLRRDTEKDKPKGRPTHSRSLNTGSSTNTNSTTTTGSQPRKPCALCKAQHYLNQCSQFLAKSMSEKKDFIMEKSLCFGCLKSNHKSKDCTNRLRCKKCNKQHPTSLHIEGFTQGASWAQPSREPEPTQPPSDPSSVDSSSAMCSSSHTQGETSSMGKCSMIVPVWIMHGSTEILTYALLDTQSDASFILESLSDALRADGPEVHLSLSTMHSQNAVVSTRKIQGLTIPGYNSKDPIPLPPLYTRHIMPADRSHIPTPETANRWPHLRRIANRLTPLQECEVGLLIGYNCPRALMPREVIPISDTNDTNVPFAQRTDLGWTIVGFTHTEENPHDHIGLSHRIWTREIPEELSVSETSLGRAPQVIFSHKTKIKEVMSPSTVQNILESDFADRAREGHSMSVNDIQFLRILEDGIQLTDKGHYEMPLPLKEHRETLPNNRHMAVQRLHGLKNKFARDQSYKEDYTKFMSRLIASGYAEPAPPLSGTEEEVWYIPHHGVYNPRKPGKLRVVFDCSARYNSISLNDCLLQGPDNVNSLLGILCRFRREPVAFSCDVEQMFHQFEVTQEHRNLLRFLWWAEADCASPPLEYRMCVHLFGATSSPGCCTFGLRYLADQYRTRYGDQVADFIHHDFYVDDGLKSVQEKTEAAELIKGTRQLCEEGGLHLHKFASNEAVLVDVPVKDQANQQTTQPIIDKGPQPIESVLGIQWCIQSDTLGFKILLQDKPLTRRGVLSTVGSIYDPLGFVAPVMLCGKQMLQELCREEIEWDAPLPDEMVDRWVKWRNDLMLLEKLEIPRCYKPRESTIATTELHHFSDASTQGYGQCSYLRQKDTDGRVSCSFVMGKARVTPLKPMTIPRLELTAAVLSGKTSNFLKQELKFEQIHREYFWTDSQIVLSYILNEARRFHVFVGNRVQRIHDLSSTDQWHYVPTQENPADEASRGLTVQELLHDSRWLKGPDFLLQPTIPTFVETKSSLSQTDPEIRVKALCSTAQPLNVGFELSRLNYFSDWYKATRAVAVILRAKKMILARVKNVPSISARDSSGKYIPVNIDSLQEAELEIIRHVQCRAFPEELKALKPKGHKGSDQELSPEQDHKGVGKSSCLYKLDPFMDNQGILRVGGRIRQASCPDSLKHPAILPRKHHITMLVARHCHQGICHQGRGMTVNEIRNQGYWVVNCTSLVSQLISSCVICRRLRGAQQGQKMADLPAERTEPAPPFTHCGVDVFGPWIIKEGRRELKRYGVLFTCLALRAVHIEVAASMTTDSFINALRRLVSIRGTVRSLRCDQGSNFIGARRELKEAWAEIDTDQISEFLRKQGGDLIFKFNSPASSHMGGVWERQIRSIRNVLATLLHQASGQLDDECLRTLMSEAMAIVNSRPLTVEHASDPTSPAPLTPNHLLTMKTDVIVPPPGNFVKEDVYSRKRWRRVQHFANLFWKRWQKEYLQNLQVRQKWQSPAPNLLVGDIVLLKEEGPRSQWPLARIQETFLGSDGRVRRVVLQVGGRTLERPIHKTVLLYSPVKV